MRPVMFRHVFLAIALLLLTAGPAQAKPPMWIIHDADSTIILFGSVHILPTGQDWQPDALKSAIAHADDLWFEIPFDDASRLSASQSLLQRSLLPQGQSLTALMAAADVERLKRVATTLGQPLASFDRMAPWMADVAISQAFVDAHGGDESSGVEEVLNREAPAGARRRAFETADDQISTLADAPRAEQLASLAETLRSVEEEPGDFNDIVTAWMKGDMAGLIRDALDPLRKTTPETYRRLITVRNRAWVPLILQRLAGSGNTVMVVGVGHLIGPDSVPAMLRARGVKVDGP